MSLFHSRPSWTTGDKHICQANNELSPWVVSYMDTWMTHWTSHGSLKGQLSPVSRRTASLRVLVTAWSRMEGIHQDPVWIASSSSVCQQALMQATTPALVVGWVGRSAYTLVCTSNSIRECFSPSGFIIECFSKLISVLNLQYAKSIFIIPVV